MKRTLYIVKQKESLQYKGEKHDFFLVSQLSLYSKTTQEATPEVLMEVTTMRRDRPGCKVLFLQAITEIQV